MKETIMKIAVIGGSGLIDHWDLTHAVWSNPFSVHRRGWRHLGLT